MATPRFCPNCQSLLEPREHLVRGTLVYFCVMCHYILEPSAEADTSWFIFHEKQLRPVPDEQALELERLRSTQQWYPCLLRVTRPNEPCQRCHYDRFILYPQRSTDEDRSMQLVFVCLRCSAQISTH